MPTEGQSPLVQKKAESVHVETDRNPLVFPFKTTQSLPFALRPALLLLETTQTGLPALKSTENR